MWFTLSIREVMFIKGVLFDKILNIKFSISELIMNKKTLFSILIGISLLLTFLVFIASQKSTLIVVEHTFDASAEKVWQLWNDPEAMKKWWSPKSYTAPVIKNDLRVDGVFLLSMQAPDGKISWNTGKYIEIIPLKKIVSMMSFSDENGNVVPASTYGVPGKWPDEIKVTVEFIESNGKTQVKIKEEGIPLIMSLFAKLGWQQQFDKFEELLK